MGLAEGEEKIERKGKNIPNNNYWKSPSINIRHQTTDSVSSENTKKNKCKNETKQNKSKQTKTKTKKNYTEAYYFQTT